MRIIRLKSHENHLVNINIKLSHRASFCASSISKYTNQRIEAKRIETKKNREKKRIKQ